jgi:hypothetical protein
MFYLREKHIYRHCARLASSSVMSMSVLQFRYACRPVEGCQQYSMRMPERERKGFSVPPFAGNQSLLLLAYWIASICSDIDISATAIITVLILVLSAVVSHSIRVGLLLHRPRHAACFPILIEPKFSQPRRAKRVANLLEVSRSTPIGFDSFIVASHPSFTQRRFPIAP